MIRAAVAATAMAVAGIAVPAEAATIVQFGNESFGANFLRFDNGLGLLNAVHLTVNILKGTTTRISTTQLVPGQYRVGYVVSGSWTLGLGSEIAGPVALTATASGASVVDVMEGFQGGPNFGILNIDNIIGSQTFNLNISNFGLDFVANPNGRSFVLDGAYSGLYSLSDTTFDFMPGLTPERVIGSCGSSPVRGEDNCGYTNYTLTYDYTPAVAVPEPATWAMMIAGFGLIGGTLRRRTFSAKRVLSRSG